MEFVCRSLKEMQKAAKEIVKHKKFPLFLMEGEMGNGKTTFVKMFGEIVGVEEAINSPTFSIIHEYEAKGLPFYHMDLYRLNKIEDFIEIGGADYLDISKGFCFVEWPEMLTPILPQDFHRVVIKESDEVRIINFA